MHVSWLQTNVTCRQNAMGQENLLSFWLLLPTFPSLVLTPPSCLSPASCAPQSTLTVVFCAGHCRSACHCCKSGGPSQGTGPCHPHKGVEALTTICHLLSYPSKEQGPSSPEPNQFFPSYPRSPGAYTL
jgi:hypothetical protein